MSKHEANIQPAATTVNVVNLLRVADAIERSAIPNLGFNMANFCGSNRWPDQSGHECNTVGCIAGWTTMLAKPNINLENLRTRRDHAQVAALFLGLDDDQAYDLFLLETAPCDLIHITPAQAAATLRHLAATGEVHWNIPEIDDKED